MWSLLCCLLHLLLKMKPLLSPMGNHGFICFISVSNYKGNGNGNGSIRCNNVSWQNSSINYRMAFVRDQVFCSNTTKGRVWDVIERVEMKLLVMMKYSILKWQVEENYVLHGLLKNKIKWKSNETIEDSQSYQCINTWIMDVWWQRMYKLCFHFSYPKQSRYFTNTQIHRHVIVLCCY